MSSKLETAFNKFHEENPMVYTLYIRFAREAKSKGYKHFGIASITERVRWEVAINTVGDKFKINNNHRAFYARLLNATSEFKDFFRTREQH